MNLSKAVFLDRDGVLNRALVLDGLPHPPRTLAELEILPGVEIACRRLKEAGFRLIVVTNQPDVARGKQSWESVEEMNAFLAGVLNIDEVVVCYHDDPDKCDCRKPAPGMLLRAAQRWAIDLAGSFMVGDRWRDIEAGRRAGCRTVLIRSGHGEALTEPPDHAADSLADACDWILKAVVSG